MPLRVRTWGQRNHVFDGGPDPPWAGEILRGKGRPVMKYRNYGTACVCWRCGFLSNYFDHLFFTFCVSRRRREIYCGHARLCVCVCVSVCPHYCTDPDVTWGSGRGCPLVVHYRADLQSVHGLRCYGSIMRMRNVSERVHACTRFVPSYILRES